MRRTVLLILAAFVVAAPASAQETIFDPENPAFDAPAEGDTSDEGDEETIFDPDNPAYAAPPGDGAVPERPAVAEPAGGGEGFASAIFVGRYASGLSVDTSFDGPEEDIVELASELFLGLEYDLSLRTRMVVGGRFTHWMGGRENPDAVDYLLNATHVRAHYEALLDEAYLVHRPGNWSLAFGNMRTPWGSTDFMRPGDVINPVDLRAGAGAAGPGATGGALLPQLTAQATYFGQGWSLQGLVVPFFAPNRFVVFGRDSALAGPRNPLVAEQLGILPIVERALAPAVHDDAQHLFQTLGAPDQTPRNASVGLRAQTTLANTDLGLGAFYGWDRTPWLELDDDLAELVRLLVADGQVLEDFDFVGFIGRNPQAFTLSRRLSEKREAGEELVVADHRRRATLLIDAARYIGPIGVRADVAFSPRRTFYTTDLEPVALPSVFAALGLAWERFSGERALAITAEGFWLEPLREDDEQLALIGPRMYGVAGGVMWELPYLERTELTLGGVYTASNRDWLARASLARRWHGWLRTTVGLALYDGPDPTETLSLGGLYSQNDQVFFSVDGAF